MKIFFYINILLTFVASSLHAQVNNTFAVSYVVTTKLVGNDYDGEYRLLYNDTASIFTNMTMPKENKIIDDGSNILTAKTGDPDGYPIYKNLKTKEMQIKYVVLTESNPCIILEPLPNINWKIMKDSREISGIKATLAICSFGGRDYQAWFAQSIPTQQGPFYFTGLPGLILEMTSIDKKVNIAFKSIQSIKEKIKIAPLTKTFNYLQITHDQYIVKKKQLIEKSKIKLESKGATYYYDWESDRYIWKKYF